MAKTTKKTAAPKVLKKSLPPAMKGTVIFFYLFVLYVFVVLVWILASTASATSIFSKDPSSRITQVTAFLLYLMLGTAFLVAAEGLRRRRSWARRTGGALGVLIALDALSKLFLGGYVYGVLGLLVGAAIAWYLFASKEAKRAIA